jgi:bis(5'-nucleosyl)-tetraphosphatase (symmetrical)
VQRIFVGDVQGCAEEFGELLARATAAFGRDFELWSVGDLANRGADNLGALRVARALGDEGRLRIVLGNHDLSLLRAAWGLRGLAPDDTFQDVLASPDLEHWLEWVRGWPLAITERIGARRFALVHASVAPGWSLEEVASNARRIEARLRASKDEARRLLAAKPEDDPDADLLARFTRCRSIDASGRWSSREPIGPEDAWHRRWSARDPDYGVVYGHWATQGLHVAPKLRGLDTGCVYAGIDGDRFLTAWLPTDDDADPFAIPDARFWQVLGRGNSPVRSFEQDK